MLTLGALEITIELIISTPNREKIIDLCGNGNKPHLEEKGLFSMNHIFKNEFFL